MEEGGMSGREKEEECRLILHQSCQILRIEISLSFRKGANSKHYSKTLSCTSRLERNRIGLFRSSLAALISTQMAPDREREREREKMGWWNGKGQRSEEEDARDGSISLSFRDA